MIRYPPSQLPICWVFCETLDKSIFYFELGYSPDYLLRQFLTYYYRIISYATIKYFLFQLYMRKQATKYVKQRGKVKLFYCMGADILLTVS